MKKILKIMALLAVPAAALTSCKDDAMDVRFTDKGPQMTVNSYEQSAFMGDSVKVNVTLKDEFPLSTLKADLLFDETVVGTTTLRTKTEGDYEIAVAVPLLAGIPDGTATLQLRAQNTGLGITGETLYVEISRPAPATLTLVNDAGRFTMNRTGDYTYEATGNFPASAKSLIECVPSSSSRTIVLGWDGSSVKPVAAGSDRKIPFAAVKAGTYKVSVNLMDLTASPFGSLPVDLTEQHPVEILNLLQGGEVDFSGISNPDQWNLDYDFFTLNADNTVTFKSLDGLYKLSADFSGKFIRVEAMSDSQNTASLQPDGSGAVWAIGAGLGKPSVGPSWNTEDGAWCLAQTEPGVYCLSLTVGASLARKDYSIKFFHQKGWGGEFGSYASVNDLTGLFKVTGSGNIEPADGDVSLEIGKSYRFTVDVRAGNSNATLTIEEIEIPVNSLDIKVNGIQASRMSATHYKIPSITLDKGAALEISGITDLASWFLDPDWLYLDGYTIRLNVVGGTFSIDLHLDYGYAEFRRLAADGSEATIDDGALWMMAWGLANPVMTNQFAFNPGAAYCMAQVEPMVFRLTGIAVDEKDGTTLGGRFRYDYISAKYFGQDGWGKEAGKILGPDSTLELRGLAAELCKVTDSCNIEFADGKGLELGSTYSLTIDLSQTVSTGKEIIILTKL